MDSLKAMRLDLARRSKWNLGYLLAGFLYWCFAATVGAALPTETAKTYWMVGGCAIFPLAILVSKLLRADPFSRGNPLGSLVALSHVSLIGVTIPLLIALFRDYPTGLPLAASLFFGAAFPV